MQLIIFVKAPRPGLVKTRLAATLGPAAACEAYCLLVETLLRGLSSLEEVELRFAPDEAAGEILRWRRNSWRMAPQGAGGLGQRLERAFRDARAGLINPPLEDVALQAFGKALAATLG